MIKFISVFCLAIMMFYAFGALASEKKLNSFRERIIWLAKELSLNGEIIRNVAKENGLTEEEMFKETESIVQNFRRSSENFSAGSTDNQRNTDAYWCLTMIQVLSRDFGNKYLPLFEDMAISSNDMVRFNGYTAYVKVAGTDSLPFIEKITKTPCLNGLDQYRIYRVFGEQISKAKKEFPKKDLSKQFSHLVDMAIRGDIRGDIIDKVLCENLPEYATSIQREAAAETMIKSSNDYLRGMGNNIKGEIEKTPKEKRKDIKAKGELLDPDRGK